MKSNLDQWFQAAKDAEPVMSIKEVEAMIKTGANPYTKKSNTGSTLKTFITMGTTLLGLAGLIGFWIFNQSPAPQQNNKAGNVPPQHAVVQANAEASSAVVRTKKKKIETSSDAGASETVALQNPEAATAPQEIPLWQNALPIAAPVGFEEKEASETVTILELRAVELARFGIKTDGASLSFISLTDRNNDTSVFKLEVSKAGSWNSHMGANYSALGENKPGNLMPVAVESVRPESDHHFYPMLSESILPALQTSFMSEAKATLVGLRVTTKGLQRRKQELVFWYKPTAAFMELLPQDLRAFNGLPLQKFSEEAYSSLVNKYREAEKQHLAEKSQITGPEKVSLAMPRTIELDKKDLKKIHIDYKGSSFEYKSKFFYHNKPARLRISYKNNNRSYHIDYNTIPIIGAAPAEKAIYPVAISDSAMQDIHFIEIESRTEAGLNAAEWEKKRLAGFMAATDTLVGIKITLSYNKQAIPVILWFEPTAALKEALPLIDMRKGEQVSNRKIDLAGIKLLELEPNSLMRLGVTVDDHGINVPMVLDGRQALFTTYTKKGTRFSSVTRFGSSDFKPDSGKTPNRITITINNDNETKYKMVPDSLGKQYPTPVLVTDDLGRYWRSYRMQEEEPGREKKPMAWISTLIPIVVKSGEPYTLDDKQQKRWRPDVILWYEPTAQFLEWLPELMGKEIGSEYEAIRNNQPAPACKYFDACQNVKGKIRTYSIYPNPVESDLNVMIDLEEDRELSISLADISGKTVKTLLSNTMQRTGAHEYAFTVSGLPEGVYLLLIETEKDERIIQRLIVK